MVGEWLRPQAPWAASCQSLGLPCPLSLSPPLILCNLHVSTWGSGWVVRGSCVAQPGCSGEPQLSAPGPVHVAALPLLERKGGR